MRTLTLVFTAILVFVLGAMMSPAVWAQAAEGYAKGESGDGGPVDDCECEEEETPPCGTCEEFDMIDIPVDMNENECYLSDGGFSDIAICVYDQMESIPGYNSFVGADDAYIVTRSDGEPIDCIGMSESMPHIGMITLGLESTDRVAKIYKFVENPTGVTTENPDAAVHITLNNDTFTVATSLTPTAAQLNSAIATAMATKYTVLDRGDYWIVKAGRAIGSITWVVVQADDEGLLTTSVQLRPFRWNVSQYDVDCGASGF